MQWYLQEKILSAVFETAPFLKKVSRTYDKKPRPRFTRQALYTANRSQLPQLLFSRQIGRKCCRPLAKTSISRSNNWHWSWCRSSSGEYH